MNLHGYVARLEDFVSAETLRLSRNLRDDAGALIKNRHFFQYSSQTMPFLESQPAQAICCCVYRLPSSFIFSIVSILK
jgi:carbohydrate-selective porin OprB